MHRLILLGLIFIAATNEAFSCSCVEGITPCSQIQNAQVAFVGRVIVDSGEGIGERPGRLVVEEVLHGLAPEIREVEVDTMPLSSCYMRLKLDERYVIFASQRSAPDRLVSGGCSYSFNLRGNEHLLEALREARAGGPARIIGRAYALDNTYHPLPLLPGVSVVAESATHRESAILSPDGEFTFSSVPSGTYRLRIESNHYIEIESRAFRAEPVSVQPGTCGYASVRAYPNGQISGSVSDPLGNISKGVPVRAFAFSNQGRSSLPEPSPFKTTTTDENGRYVLNGLPPGEFIIGTDGERTSDYSVYPPVISYGGNQAARVRLNEFDRIEVNLPPDPRQPSMLTVQLRLEDGTAVEGATLRILGASGEELLVAKDKSNASGFVTMEVYQAGRIELDAFKRYHTGSYSDGSIQFKKLVGNPGPILFEGPAMTVQIIMRDEQPQPR